MIARAANRNHVGIPSEPTGTDLQLPVGTMCVCLCDSLSPLDTWSFLLAPSVGNVSLLESSVARLKTKVGSVSLR